MSLQILRGQEKTTLWIRVTGQYPVEMKFDFSHQCASEVERNLLEAHLRDVLASKYEALRRISYNMGWRHAKGKKVKKNTYFQSCIDVTDWERKEAGQ